MVCRNLVLVFGETEIAEGVITLTINPAGPADVGISSAEVVVASKPLLTAPVDYRSEVQLFEVIGDERELRFTGIVDAVTPAGDTTTVSLVTGLQLLAEEGTGGLGIDPGTKGVEVVWSLLRAWGIEAERIDLEGFEPGPPGMFEVAAAVDGFDIDEPVELGGVMLLPTGPISRLADGLGPDELRKEYVEASTWVLALPTASTLFEAETKGLKTIDIALAWLTALVQYSAPRLPGGNLRSFRRRWTSAHISRRDAVVVKRSTTGERWMRKISSFPAQVPLAVDQVTDLKSNTRVPTTLPVTMGEALLAWRRAAQGSDPVGAVVALWEAAEFYASGTKREKMFEDSELKAIRVAAMTGLEGDKAQRVSDILSRLNEPPLMARLRTALDEDRVPHTVEELALLQRIRKARNDLVHGRSRVSPSEADLQHAIAIVNRMLVYRVNRLSRQMSKFMSTTVTP